MKNYETVIGLEDVYKRQVCIYFVQKIFKLVPTFPADRLLSGGML